MKLNMTTTAPLIIKVVVTKATRSRPLLPTLPRGGRASPAAVPAPAQRVGGDPGKRQHHADPRRGGDDVPNMTDDSAMEMSCRVTEMMVKTTAPCFSMV